MKHEIENLKEIIIMHIDINDNTSLKEIRDTFSNFYPYLSLSFFHSIHHKYESSSPKDSIDLNKTIGQVRKTHISALIEIQPTYSTADVEKEFQQKVGIGVQVLKKEKDSWEQSTGLDNLSLKDLNIMGMNSSDEFIVTDYDESFEEEAE